MFYFLVYNDDTHKDNINTLLESVKKYGTSFQIIVFEKNNIDKEFVWKYDAILSCERGGDIGFGNRILSMKHSKI